MKKILFGVAALGLLGLAGAGIGLKTQDTVEAKADGVSGKITLDMTGYWADSYKCKLAMYFFNDTLSVNSWSDPIYVETGTPYAEIPYDLGFTPEGMIAVRFSDTETDFRFDKYDGEKHIWNKTGDLEFSDNAHIIIDGELSGYVGYPYIASSTASWGSKLSLSHFKINGSGNIEYYSKSVSLTAEEEFKVVIRGAWSGNYSKSEYVSGFSGGGSENIKCGVPGTYALYFDARTRASYITDPVLATADEWAQTFLAGVTCDGEGSITKDEWSSLSETYADLDDGVKTIFTGIAEDGNDSGTYAEKAVCRYDYIVKKYGTTAKPDFMGRKAAGKIDPKASYATVNLNGEGNNTTVITIGIGVVAALAIGGAFIARKRRAE